MNLTVKELRAELNKLANPERAKKSAYYFKTGEGQYGFGDVFLGVSVPAQRVVAKKYRELPLKQVEQLLKSKIHEERLTASIILVDQFKRANKETRHQIYDFYLANTANINNWDIIDGSAPYIVGGWLEDKDRRVLVTFARSKTLWDRRIAIMATFPFIREGDATWTFKIADLLLNDNEDLIHKAVGWMLREVGNSCGHDVEEKFLKLHYKTMPRTMLRYAIEKFDEPKRQQYLKGEL